MTAAATAPRPTRNTTPEQHHFDHEIGLRIAIAAAGDAGCFGDPEKAVNERESTWISANF
jgi:hypothetical protein